MAKYVIGVPVLVAVLAFGYYAISPLFRNIQANDALPKSSYVQEGIMDEEMPTSVVGSSVAEPALPAAKVTGTVGHPASGTVRIVEADGKKYVRYENFKTINGPDIFVYLATDLEASEFVDLGRVKATEGNINYEIPAGVDPSDYPYVLTWCKAFGVLFNSAKVY